MSIESPQSVHPRMRSIDRRANLRPLSGSEVLDLGTHIYRRIALSVLPRTFAPSMLCAAAIAFSTTFIQTNLLRTSAGTTGAGQFAEAAVAILLALFVGGPLFVVGVANASGPVIRLASDCMLGEEPNLKAADEAGAKAVGSLTTVMFSVVLRSLWVPMAGILCLALSVFADSVPIFARFAGAVPAVLGFLGLAASLVIVPLIIHRTALAPVLAVLEGLKGKPAIKRASELMLSDKTLASTTGTSISFMLLALVLYLSISMGISAVFSLLNVGQLLSSFSPGPWAHALIIGLVKAFPFWLALWVILPFWGSVTTTLYYDRRVRLEGFDIQKLSEDITHADRQTALLN